MFRLRLVPPSGQSTLSFAEGTNLWETIFLAGQKNGSTAKILQSTMFDEIMKDNDHPGREIKNRLQTVIKLKSLSKEFETWEQDNATYILLLDASVRELSAEDALNLPVPSKPTSTGNRRTSINVNNTSMCETHIDNERLTRCANYLSTYSEEDSANAQYLMDLDHAIGNSQQEEQDLQDLHVSSVPIYNQQFPSNMYQRGQDSRNMNRNNGQQQSNPGRGNGGSGRFPPSYNRGQPTSASQHTSCMCCGGPHPFPTCAYKMDISPLQSPTIARVDLYRMDPNKLKNLPYADAMNLIQSSTNNGNMKYQSDRYRSNMANMLELNNEQKKRAAMASVGQLKTPDIVVASCRIALSKSAENIHTPYGVYKGSYGQRPQHVFSNDVLAHSQSEIRQATDEEITLHIETKTSNDICNITSLPHSPGKPSTK
jgi:hypothetical protein